MQKYYALSFLVMLACSNPVSTLKQIYSQKLTDSLKNELAVQADHFLFREEFAEAEAFLRAVEHEPMASANASVKSGWWRLRGRFAQFNEKYDSARYFYSEAKKLLNSDTALYRDKIFLLIQEGWLENDQRHYESAIKLGLEAFHLAQEKSTKDIPQTCLLLSSIHNQTGDHINWQKYLQKGLSLSTDSFEISYLSMSLSDLYSQSGNIDSSIYYAQNSLAYTTKTNNHGRMANLDNIGTLLAQQGKPADAIKIFQQSLEVERNLQDSSGLAHGNIAKAYLIQKDYVAAFAHADTAVKRARQQQNWGWTSTNYQTLSAIYQARHNLTKAVELKDSAFMAHLRNDTAEMSARMQEIETQYAVRAKDERISNLAAVAATTAKINQQRQFIIIALGIGSMLIIFIAVLLFRRRGMRLQIREHELQQQLLRSQMEDHFLYNTLGNLQHLIRSEDLQGALLYLGRFSRIIQMNQFNSRSNYVSLIDEISALEAYLALQRMHLNDSFEFEISTYEGMEEDGVTIPPMLLQPFVENAVIHGIRGLPYKGKIRIVIVKFFSVINCKIEDNGNGQQIGDKNIGKVSMSTTITTERLRILSKRTGQRGSLQIQHHRAGASTGTVVHLEIPYRYGQYATT